MKKLLKILAICIVTTSLFPSQIFAEELDKGDSEVVADEIPTEDEKPEGNEEAEGEEISPDSEKGDTVSDSVVKENNQQLNVPSKNTEVIKSIDEKSVYLKYATNDSQISDLQFATWSDANGQDDLKWYVATKGNGYFDFNINISDHRNSGSYQVHVYAKYKDGSFKHLESTSFDILGTAITEDIKVDLIEESQTFKITVSGINAPSGVTKVQIPTWSNINGQDDLVWYNATRQGDGSYVVISDISKHKFSNGEYTSHIYVTTGNGIVSYSRVSNFNMNHVSRTKTSINAAETQATISYNKSSIMSNYTLLYAVWSDARGQDDLAWYSANNDGKFVVNLSNHKNASGYSNSGVYSVHTYLKNASGKMFRIDTSNFEIETQLPFNVETTKLENGKFDVIVRDLSSSVTRLQVPIWSNVKGQDDLVWYEAKKQSNGTWRVTVDINNHNGDEGDYQLHLYAYRSSTYSFVGSSSKTVITSKGDITFENIGGRNTNIKITLTNSDYQNYSIKFAIWSSANNQDDLKWYTATKVGNTSTYTVNITNHKTNGSYIVHTYAYDSKGTAIFLGNDNFVIDENLTSQIEILNVKKFEGTYQVRISDVDAKSGVDKVLIPVWCNKNQSDLYWYTAQKQPDGSYIANIDSKNHGYSKGMYKTHVYIYAKNGIEKSTAQSNVELTPEVKMTTSYEYIGSGAYKLTLSNVPGNVTNVQFPTWSNTNGQNDMIWYVASNNGNGTWSTLVNAQNHKYTGTFTSHVYATQSGQAINVAVFEFNVPKIDFTPPYFSQNGSPWGNYYYGAWTMRQTGCVPTSLAMIFSAYLGRIIPPNEIANYLWEHTNEFNKHFGGASGLSVQYAANNYGLRWRGISSHAQLNQALSEGKKVIALVGPGIFVSSGYTHAIVLEGYSNGSTLVRDPNGAGKNGWYSTGTIWNQQSKAAEDWRGGYVFYSISDK